MDKIVQRKDGGQRCVRLIVIDKCRLFIWKIGNLYVCLHSVTSGMVCPISTKLFRIQWL